MREAVIYPTKIFLAAIVTFFLVLTPMIQAGAVDDGHCVVGADQGSTTWYFAEGCTRSGFNTFLCLGNPNNQSVSATITYYLGNGATISRIQQIPANSRSTIFLNGDNQLGFRDDVSGDVSIKVESTSGLPIIAERPMYFDGTYKGGHDVMGAFEPANAWYFAEGYTGPGFDEWICIMNPGGAPASVNFRFQTQEVGEIVKQGLIVNARSRQTYKVNDLLGQGYQASLQIESNQPIVAERSMYFNYLGMGNHNWQGGHCVMGITELSKEYFFAEGCTRYPNFEQWITLQNANDVPITVDAFYQLGPGQGDPVVRSYDLGPRTRDTVFVEGEVGRDKDVSVKLSSSSYFLAERPMYFNYQYGDLNARGGHCVIGSSSTSSDWFFAEGYTGSGFNEWLCLQNPNSESAALTMYFLTQEAGMKTVGGISIPAHSRYTVMVNAVAGDNLQLSSRIESSKPIVAERPMYFSYGMILPPPPPEPTPPPPPPPPPPPGGLIVLDHTSYTDTINYLHIVGEVQNTTSSNIEFGRIVATIYNSSGGVIATDFTYTYLDILAPGEKSPFHVLSEMPPGFANYTLQTEYRTTSTPPNRSLTILSQSSNVDSIGYLHIVGEVRNDSGHTIEFCEISGTMYDSGGKVVETDFTYTSISTLSPGQTSPFELLISSNRASLVHHWNLYTQYRVK